MDYLFYRLMVHKEFARVGGNDENQHPIMPATGKEDTIAVSMSFFIIPSSDWTHRPPRNP